jgi:hypothetical protein
MQDPERLVRPDGETLALRRVDGSGPTVLWIGGFRSDMEGTKALALDAAARARGGDPFASDGVMIDSVYLRRSRR